MNNRKLRVSIFIILVIMILFSCKINSDKVYTIWIDSVTYSDFSSTIYVLDDGDYIKSEISNAYFDYWELLWYSWTENDIYSWFIDRDFIPSEANELTEFVTTTNHCLIAVRFGDIVYMLIKRGNSKI